MNKCDYSHLPHSGGGTNHGPAVVNRGGYNICQKCADAMTAAEHRMDEAYRLQPMPEPKPVPKALTPEQMWERFMDHLAKVDPIGPRKDPIVRHGAFLGDVNKYKAIFLEANK